MDVERLNPPGVHTPAAKYSQVARAGQTLYLAGQVAIDADGSLVGHGDAGAQARQIFANIETICKHFGGSLASVQKVTIYLTNWDSRAPVSEVRDALFSAPYPASTLVVVAALASPDYLLEIEAIAVLDD
jgi:enamine deaminase RidA (YjgF/YER057c/UK114 family)